MTINIIKKWNLRSKLMAITPIVATIIAVLMLYFGRTSGNTSLMALCWTPYLLIPLMTIILGYWRIKFTFPIFISVLYLAVCLTLSFGFNVHIWHPGWVIFLTIPIYEILVSGTGSKKEDKKKENEDDDKVIDI